MIKKTLPFQMPSSNMIFHSKIWQQLRWEPDNNRDKQQPQVINDSQAYSPVLTEFLQKRGNGKHRAEPQYKPSETILMKKHLLRIDLQTPGTIYCWSCIKLNIGEELSASKQVWEKSRANLQHMGITKTRCSQFGCINVEYVCVSIHLCYVLNVQEQ